MHSVSQWQALEEMPLEGQEESRFWRDERFGGMECLSATFFTHEYAPHSHDTFSIGAIEVGSQVCSIKGCRAYSQPGDLYLINPGVMHDGASAEGGYRYRMIYPDARLYRDIIEDMTGRAFNGLPSFPDQHLSDAGLSRAFFAAHRALEYGTTLEAEESMFTVLAAIFRRHGEWSAPPVDTPERSAVRRARDYLAERYADEVGLEELATVAGLSRAHLIRAFRREYFITPHAFQTHLRIRAACGMLRRGDSPTDVALACGFADQAHFTRHFKARIGTTPGRFRAA
ncbi:AraC family transcriptional regulator [Rhizobiaceae bacterium BDR2-2]|uniref:AraC family transcriptional regulator n=1 Tax=Ectorhizobium quercum TaxID=2965071 RepID=A0AAE3N1Y5_9HYPH|nr:AraC family transcriptional regulator [Ectorhizobium quercum]MCX8999049.1 AraC family transcriptional regulator [Ectorhizobium quercum]